MSSLMKMFDILGSRIFFYYKNNSIIKSNFGGLITLLTGILLALLLLGFGRDFFKRTNPTFIPKTESPEEFPQIIINNKNLSFAFTLEDTDGLPKRNDSIFYIDFNYWGYVKDENGIFQKVVEELLPVSNCEAKHFGDENIFEKKGFASWACPDFNNITLGGDFGANFVYYLRIEVKLCPTNGFNPRTGVKCGSEEDRINFMSNRVFFSTITQHVLVNPSNYNSPLTYDYLYSYKLLIDGFIKRQAIYFQRYKVESDFGWILQTSKIQEILGQNYIVSDFVLENEKINYFDTMIYVDKNINSYRREYIKVQKLAAEVGGILKLVIMLSQIIIQTYSNLIMKIEFSNEYIEQNEFNKIFSDKIIEETQFKNKFNFISCNINNNEINNNSSIAISKGIGIENTILSKSKKNISIFKPEILKENSNALKSNIEEISSNINDKQINVQKYSEMVFDKWKKENPTPINYEKAFIFRDNDKQPSYLSISNFIFNYYPSLFCKSTSNPLVKRKQVYVRSISDYINDLLSVERLLDTHRRITMLERFALNSDQKTILEYTNPNMFLNFYEKHYKHSLGFSLAKRRRSEIKSKTIEGAIKEEVIRFTLQNNSLSENFLNNI